MGSWAAWIACRFLTFLLLSQRATVLLLSQPVRLILRSNMLSTFLALFIAFLAVSAPVGGRPTATRRGHYEQLWQEPIQLRSLGEPAGSFPEINVLVEGSPRFRDSKSKQRKDRVPVFCS